MEIRLRPSIVSSAFRGKSHLAALLFIFVVPLTTFADSLSVEGVNCASALQTVSSGSASGSCTSGGTTTSSNGNLTLGTIGASAQGEIGTTAQIELNFFLFGVRNSPTPLYTVQTDLQIHGNLIGNGTATILFFPVSVYPPGHLLNQPTVFGAALSSGETDLTVVTTVLNALSPLDYELIVNGSASGGGADFSDTVQITGASVYDTNGNLVPGATLISDSGFNPNAVLTPEPSSLLLLGTGLLALVGASKLKFIVS